MRVISGSLKGRIYSSPKSAAIHPMSEKMRGAIFSALGDIEGLTILDAYSGSGAISIECASRGSKEIIAIEGNKRAVNLIKENIKTLNINNIKIIQATVEGWLKTSSDRFDVIIADPPYDNIKEKTILALSMRLSSGGVLVLSWPNNIELPTIGSLMLLKKKDYGDSQLGFFRSL